MLPPARTFRVFVSSTFSDLKAEREALHNLVFPAIRLFCEERGARFDAVDLRWGISEQAGRDHRTMRVCLEEVRRCRETTPRPNFLVLLGDRYGWTPLPAELPSGDFARIYEAAVRIPGAVDLAGLYPETDTNADPPVVCLRPRGGESDDDWRKLERKAVALIRKLAHDLDLSADVPAACGGSATEQEIYEGLLRHHVRAESSRRVHAFLREVGDPPGEKSAEQVFDYVDGELDAIGRDAARLLKQELRMLLPEPAVHKHRVDWVGTALDTSYLGNIVTSAHTATRTRTAAAAAGSVTTSKPAQNLCQDIYDTVTGMIEQELGDPKPASSIEAEVSAHKEFAKQRGDERTFTGRKTVSQPNSFLHRRCSLRCAGRCRAIRVRKISRNRSRVARSTPAAKRNRSGAFHRRHPRFIRGTGAARRIDRRNCSRIRPPRAAVGKRFRGGRRRFPGSVEATRARSASKAAGDIPGRPRPSVRSQ